MLLLITQFSAALSTSHLAVTNTQPCLQCVFRHPCHTTETENHTTNRTLHLIQQTRPFGTVQMKFSFGTVKMKFSFGTV
jgi:hypothetical protein